MKLITLSLLILLLLSFAYPANAATIDLVRSTVEYTDNVDQCAILEFVLSTPGLSNEEVRYLIKDIPSEFNVDATTVQISSNMGAFDKVIKSSKIALKSITALNGNLEVKIKITIPSDCPENTYTLKLSEMVGSESDMLNPSSIGITVQKSSTKPSTPTLYDPGTTDTDGDYTVSWTSVSSATSYTLEEDTSSSFGSPTVVHSGAGTSKYITGKSDGTYYYRVKACNAYGCSGWSNIEYIEVEIPTGNVITVDDSGGADYTTIQEAVDNAGSGYTIKVFAGTYNEHVATNKSLKLIGEDKDTTIIDGGGSGKCIYVIADNVEVSGFTIRNAIDGVYLDSSDTCIIDDNIISENYDGIHLSNSNSITISHNSLSNNIAYICGIHLSSSNNNLIRDNDLSGNSGGISLSSSHNNHIYHNSLTDNSHSGIRLSSSNSNVVQDNDISRNDAGIYLYSSNSNLIYHNNLRDNTEQAYDNTGTNSWDNGATEGGNYWSDHSICIGNPSDGSQPNHIDSGGIDNYPFQDKNGWIIISDYDVIIGVASTEKTVALGEIATYLVTVKNIGYYSDSYTLSVEITADLDVAELSRSTIKNLAPQDTVDALLTVSDTTEGEYNVDVIVTSQTTGNSGAVCTNTIVCASAANFDTDSPINPYPSIPGTHTGTITPNQNITVQKLDTYPCTGTGGHTEYVWIYGNDLDESALWDGYAENWDTITFDSPFTLESGKTYNYVIKTGSYPQIHHTAARQTANGWINCSKFTDANGKEYKDWIPAIRLFSQIA